MGKSVTVPVVVEMKTLTAEGPKGCTPMPWRSGLPSRANNPGYGRPTTENLKAFIKKFEDSTKPGGVNEHLGTTVVTSAFIKDQATGQVLASYTGPAFIAF